MNRVSVERMDVRFTGEWVQRGNSLNLFCNMNEMKVGNRDIYFGQNFDSGTDTAHTWETFTQDTSGGAYFERVTAVGVNTTSGRQIITTVAGYERPHSAYPIVAGLAVSVLQGAGVGQWRNIVTVRNLSTLPNGAFELELDSPFTVPLALHGAADESVIAINGYKGNFIFEANEWTNGTTVQTYGNSNDFLLSGNVLRDFWNVRDSMVPSSCAMRHTHGGPLLHSLRHAPHSHFSLSYVIFTVPCTTLTL
jgi:hypothetical protein